MSTDNTLIKLKATADILGGDVFRATSHGEDPENPSNDGLLANGLYIRLSGSDGSIAYISVYEIDEAINKIDNLSKNKATKSELDSLENTVKSKISIEDFEKTVEKINSDISKIDETILDLVSEKADKSIVDNISLTLESKANTLAVEELQSYLDTKASSDDLEILKTIVNEKAVATELKSALNEINILKDTVGKLSADSSVVPELEGRIAELELEIINKLTDSDLTEINLSINNLKTDTNNLKTEVTNIKNNIQNNVASKVYVQGQISDINRVLTTMANTIDDKATKAELDTKTNLEDFNKSNQNIKNLNNELDKLSKSTKEDYDNLLSKINRKAEISDIKTTTNQISAVLNSKADKTKIIDDIAKIENTISEKESIFNDEINEIHGLIDRIDCDIKDYDDNLNTKLKSRDQQISNHTNQIKALQETDNTINEKLKQPWVRVLTTNEYKNLITPPDGAPYSNRYKYPNMIYLLVDFNKPKALYIGDIMVAQAEQIGSIGFAYNFPIIF